MRAFASRSGAPPAAMASVPVQRCACGSAGSAPGEMCEDCREEQALGVQPKLIVGAPGDPCEREADAAASAVAGERAPSVGPDSGPVAEVRRTASLAPLGHAAPESVSRTISRPGEALDRAARRWFEPRFGHDFGEVRVHRDAEAAASARDVAARAYTVGNHVVFGAGSYAPADRAGRALIAHELAHVVQQGGTVRRHPLSPEPEVRSSEPDEEEEDLQLAETSGEEEAAEPDEERMTDTAPEEEEEAEAGLAALVQRQPLDDEPGDPWPEKTGAAGIRAEMDAAQKCLDETPEDPAECEPDRPLTWDDFQKKPKSSKFGAATWSKLKKRPTNTRLLKCMPKSAAAEAATPAGVQAFFDPAKSWVKTRFKEPSNLDVNGCKDTIAKCRKHFRKNRNKQGVWWAMSTSAPGKCPASATARGDRATSSDECGTVVAEDCADRMAAESARLLKHEQGHFDLSCAMAKKANAMITKDTNVDRLIKAANKVLSRLQKRYDKESRHGCIESKQDAWETAIADGLPDVEIKVK